MAEHDDPTRIGLAEAIAGLRADLSQARRESAGHDVRFGVDKVEIELTVDFGIEREARGGMRLFSFIDLSGKSGSSEKSGHKVKLTLSVDDGGDPSAPFRLTGPGPGPVLEDEPDT